MKSSWGAHHPCPKAIGQTTNNIKALYAHDEEYDEEDARDKIKII